MIITFTTRKLIIKTLTTFVGLGLILLLSSCSTVKVVSDTDKTTDFSQYKTYSFLGWQDNSDAQLSVFDKKRLRVAFASELEARGMSYQESADDMAISLFIVINQKTSVTDYTDYYVNGGYGIYSRYNRGWGYGYGNPQTTYQEDDYMKGTLIMDVFDGKSNEQVWQGIAVSTIAEKPEKRKKTIPKQMDKFPVVEISK